jgi:hypothetical protein
MNDWSPTSRFNPRNGLWLAYQRRIYRSCCAHGGQPDSEIDQVLYTVDWESEDSQIAGGGGTPCLLLGSETFRIALYRPLWAPPTRHRFWIPRQIGTFPTKYSVFFLAANPSPAKVILTQNRKHRQEFCLRPIDLLLLFAFSCVRFDLSRLAHRQYSLLRMSYSPFQAI